MDVQAAKAHVMVSATVIKSNLEFTEFELSLQKYAKDFGVPIILNEGLSFLETIIRLYKPKRILEIGSAIGYSAIRMSRVCGSEVYTIERNEKMYNEALQNVKKAGLQDKIHVYLKDALEAFSLVESYEFDMIFIDAAKAQYTKFFEMYTKLLAPHGVVVCDNMEFHGLVDCDTETYNKQTRAVRGLIRKLHAFHDSLLKNEEYDTSIFLNVGDGMSVSVKR